MNYSIFNDCQANRLQGETDQEHMERIFTECMIGTADDSMGINDMFEAKLAECSVKEKFLVLEYEVKDWMLNPAHMLHGGIMSTCCDMAMGMLARYMTQSQKCVTVNLNVNFLLGVKAGRTILVKAKAEKQGKRVQFLSAQIFDKETGRQAVDCTAVFM